MEIFAIKLHQSYFTNFFVFRLLCDSNPTHLCRKLCGQECGTCDYPKNVTLQCSHDVVIPCHINPEDYDCPIEVQVTLPCGHEANKPCYLEVAKYNCKISCDARLDCGHSCYKKCHAFDDPDHLLVSFNS